MVAKGAPMEHCDLVADMWRTECMSTRERLALARRRRAHQLKSWSMRERECRNTDTQKSAPRIRFPDNVVLLEAASRNDLQEVKELLVKGVSPDSTNDDGLTALHQCCIDDNEEMMLLLLEFGANVNAEDSEKWTPLHAAATCGHLHLVRHLIAHGAELLAVNSDGNMPYDICEDEATLEAIEREMSSRGISQALVDETRAATETAMLTDLRGLAASGDDLEYTDNQGATPLHIAAANGYLRVVEFLLDHHVSTEVKDIDGWEPIHAAACWGHMDVVETLVQNGADLNAVTKDQETPADMCEDPELRERITELWREQERRRRGSSRNSLSSGVRRAGSNSRARSVRRTSVRERGLQAKRDALGEAEGLRLLGEPVRRDPDGAAPDALTSLTSVSSTSSSPPGTTTTLEVPAEASFSEESNGKINIHVSVTINAGTLAELKRNRAQSRSEGGSGSTSPASSLPAISPDRPRRFAGDTAESVVVDARWSARKCCCIA